MTHRCIAQDEYILVVGTRARCVSVDMKRGWVYDITSLESLSRFGNYRPVTASDADQARAVALATPTLDAEQP